MSHFRKVLKRAKAPPRAPVLIWQLTSDHCHYIINGITDPRYTLYCAQQTVERNGKKHSWCSGCFKRVYRPVNVHDK